MPTTPAPPPAAPETALLRAAGLRVTGPRRTVLGVVGAHPHAEVGTIVAATRARAGSVSVQAVYDVLRVLTEAGLVRRVEPAGSPARYEVDSGDNHHHVVCRGCGRLQDVPCATGRRPCLDPGDGLHGFHLDEAEVLYWGLCPDCQQTTTHRGAAAPTKESA